MDPSVNPALPSLVVCADDYGMNASVSQAIVELGQGGRITATSAMVLAADWPRHALGLAPLRGRLDVGLHLDWTSDFAQQAGHGMPLPGLMLRSACRLLDARQVRLTIEQQLDLFEAHWQAPPDHVDGHQHVHQFPVIREQLIQALATRYPDPGTRPWLRISRPLHPGTDLKARVIGAMGARALSRLAERAGFAHSRWLTGIYDFGPGDHSLRLSRWLAQAWPHRAVVLMCHPGMAASDPTDPIAPARAREHEALMGVDWLHQLQAQGLQLARGRTCLSLEP